MSAILPVTETPASISPSFNSGMVSTRDRGAGTGVEDERGRMLSSLIFTAAESFFGGLVCCRIAEFAYLWVLSGVDFLKGVLSRVDFLKEM